MSTDEPPRRGYWAGARIGAGLAASSFVLAVTFGALARQEGWGTVAPIVASLVVFSGSAQFALVTALAGGGVALAAVTSAALINLRSCRWPSPSPLTCGAEGSGGRWRGRRWWTGPGLPRTRVRAASTALR